MRVERKAPGSWKSNSAAAGWLIATGFVAITAALAAVARTSDPAAAIIVFVYLVPIAVTSAFHGRLRAAAVGVASLLAVMVVWPGSVAPERLGFLVFITIAGGAAVVATPWLTKPVAPHGRHLAPAGEARSSMRAAGGDLGGAGVSTLVLKEQAPADVAVIGLNGGTDETEEPAAQSAEEEAEPVRKAVGAEEVGAGQPALRLAGAKSGHSEEPGSEPSEVTSAENPRPAPPGTAPSQGGQGPYSGTEERNSADANHAPATASHAGTNAPVPPPQFVTAALRELDLVADLFKFCRAQVPAAQMGIFFTFKGAEQLVPGAFFGFDSADLVGVAAKRGAGLAGIVALAARPQLRADLDADIAEPDVTRLLYTKRALRSAIALPVATEKMMFGVMALYSTRLSAFTHADVGVVQRACRAAAPMIGNMRTLAELEREVQQARLTIQMARFVGPHGSLDELMGFVLEKAKEVVDGEVASVMLTDPATNELWIGRADGLPAGVVSTTKLAPGCGIAGWVAANARPLILRDFPLDGGNGKVKWAVSLPLRDNGRVVGVLNVGSNNRDKKVADEQMRMLLELASQAGSSIQNARALGAMQELHLETMRALVGAIEQADPYGRGHSENVSRYATAIARRLGLSPDEVKAIETAGMLHDVGKATLGEGLLRKGRPLTTVEQAAIQLHPTMAGELLKDVPMLAEIIPAITHHHERFDGGGYGQGLKGEEIPLASRILAAADAFDAMISERAYRPAKSVSEAAEEMRRGAGSQFDPKIVAVFTEILSENPALVAKGTTGRA